jgi:hypothetical protein
MCEQLVFLTLTKICKLTDTKTQQHYVKAHAFSNLRQTYGVHVFYFKMLPTAKNL